MVPFSGLFHIGGTSASIYAVFLGSCMEILFQSLFYYISGQPDANRCEPNGKTSRRGITGIIISFVLG